jgi:hypothetical protein
VGGVCGGDVDLVWRGRLGRYGVKMTKEAKEAVLVVVYLLFNMNVINHMRVRDALNLLVREEIELEGIEKVLVEEVKKIPGAGK